MEKTLPISIVVVSYNTRELLRCCLVSVLGGEFVPAQFIVVDNASSDGSVELLAEQFPGVIVIKNDKNLGFAKANNEAIRQVVNQPYVWLLNSDTEIATKTLGQLYKYMEGHKEVGGVVPQLVYPNGSWQSVGGWFPSVSNVFLQLFPVHWLFPVSWRKKLKLIANHPTQIPTQDLNLDYGTGAALFLRKDALDQVGLLGEEYFMYFEETDLCWRLRRQGWLIKALATEPVMHVYGGSFKTKNDPKRLKYFWQSLLIFVNKNYRGFNKMAIIAQVWLFSRLSQWLKTL